MVAFIRTHRVLSLDRPPTDRRRRGYDPSTGPQELGFEGGRKAECKAASFKGEASASSPESLSFTLK